MLFEWIPMMLTLIAAWSIAGMLFGLVWYGARELFDDVLAIRLIGTLAGTILLTPRLVPAWMLGHVPVPAVSLPVLRRFADVPGSGVSAGTIASVAVTAAIVGLFIARASIEAREARN